MSADDEDEDEDEDEYNDDDDDDDSPKHKKKAKGEKEADEAVQEDLDSDDLPDIISINEFDFDFGFSALCFAILFASVPTIEALIAAGADLKLISKAPANQSPLHPLTLTILREDEEEACQVAECLLKAGATSSSANDFMRTIFHAAVHSGRSKLVETMLRCDPHSSKVVNFPVLQNQHVVFPIVTAINKKYYGIVALLLANGAKLELDEKDITRATEAAPQNTLRYLTSYGSNTITNYVELAYQPLEVAIKNHDDLGKLLINLGVTVDFGTLQSLGRYSDVAQRRTIKDWIDMAIVSIENQIASKNVENVEVADSPMAAPDEEDDKGWMAYYKKHHNREATPRPHMKEQEAATKRRQARIEKQDLEYMQDIREFLVEIQSLLTAKGAKTWAELYPTVESQATIEGGSSRNRRNFRSLVSHRTVKPSDTLKISYVHLSPKNSYDRNPVAQHLNSAYEELFEACFSGDNDRVQRLCLPIEGQETDGSSDTPLSAAIAGRQWATAKLVLAIATAQYHPADNTDKIKFNRHVDLDDDSDNESCASDDSDMTVDQQEIKFIDIATRPSAVQSVIHPKTMLTEAHVRWLRLSADSTEPSRAQAAPLAKAVADHDLDAFKHIADLYQSLAEPLQIGEDIMDRILDEDQADILDEYLRRTGDGLDIALVKKEANVKEDLPIATNDANKMYLGLDVHGKKRIDLARKNDPNATHDAGEEKRKVPLLWRAIKLGAKNIIEYLTTEKPFEAYRAYATSTTAHGELKARWLRRYLFGESGAEVASLPKGGPKKQLAVWLGWTINALGESPLAAAIISNKMEMIELLNKLEPELMAQALKTKIKFVGMNMLFFAVQMGSDIKIVDYLLAKSISAADKDSIKGWNMYHYLSQKNNKKLLGHLLQKLPQDVNETLLKQQSKRRFNTPLQVAIKNGHVEIASILLGYTPTSSALLQIRDVDGQTPLHCSVRRQFVQITRHILDTSRALPSISAQHSSLLGDLLHTEDSVGLTPFEIASVQVLTHRLEQFSWGQSVHQYAVEHIASYGQVEVEPRRTDVKRAVVKLADEREGSRWKKVFGMVYVSRTRDDHLQESATEKGVEDVKRVVARLEAEAAAGDGEKVGGALDMDVLREWVKGMERLLERSKERERRYEEEEMKDVEETLARLEELKKQNESWRLYTDTLEVAPITESQDLTGTYDVVRAAIAALQVEGLERTPRRHLVHLFDVQRSVASTLASASGGGNTANGDEEDGDGDGDYYDRESSREARRLLRAHRHIAKHGAVGELEGEGDVDVEEERRERKTSMVFQHITMGPDML
ncbi:hypothetical protein JR316_0005308 [Psilocybe cubensis]|uniref:Uncharacterized protein n=2 Tax=Psilocybe cubensis TaxID=181762 RepID=A0ACB8H5T5_PSICU|nr:hypothetical protein JR316_0005308 [Psilocybe cubensis]KAH9483204.1 hypothetical protein JR316_0005308 [Psilocybe cubensis]